MLEYWNILFISFNFYILKINACLIDIVLSLTIFDKTKEVLISVIQFNNPTLAMAGETYARHFIQNE